MEEDFYFEDLVNCLFLLDPTARGDITGVFRQPNTPWVQPDRPLITLTIPGQIDYIESKYRNFDRVELQGLDFEVFYHHRTETLGDFFVRHYSVYIDRYISGGFDLVGFVGIPEYQMTNSLQWVSPNRNFAAVLNALYMTGYATEFIGVPDVGSYYTLDFHFTYSGFFDTEITLGVENLLDRDPPANVTVSESYDRAPGAYNPYGGRVSNANFEALTRLSVR